MQNKLIVNVENAINWVHERTTEKQFLIFSSILVGVTAGLAAVLLKIVVAAIRNYVVQGYLLKIDNKYWYLLLPVIGIGITVLIIRTFFKEKFYKGTASILYAIAKKSSFLPFQQIYSPVITSAVTVGLGGSAGLESPIVSAGAAIGSNFSRTYKLSYKERTLLLASGVAGGIAGAFNAPIAGVLFALEVILIDISISAFIPLLIAAATGALMSKIAFDESGILFFKLKQPFDYHNVPFYIVLGILSGLVSLYYSNVFEKVEKWFEKEGSKFKRWIYGSLSLVFLIAMFPTLFGEGYDSILRLSEFNTFDIIKDSILLKYVTGKWSLLVFILLVMLFKVFAAAVTIGGGGNGGNFAPSLFVGAYLGFVFSFLLTLLGFNDIPVSNFTIVAMAGILSGFFHAPLTAIFLIAEITGGYELIIPLMLVSSISYAFVKYFHPDSLDVKKLKAAGAIVSEDKDTSILGQIDTRSMIETDFATVHFKSTLRDIVETIKHCRRNTFPVVKKNNKLLGVIYLDNIREEMFNPELYDKITARELMRKPGVVIDINEDIFVIMKKFEESGQWNLPVVDQGIYVGFLSKSSILDKYRNQLLRSV